MRKGGESMSLEAIKQVTEAEQANLARKAEGRLADAAESIVRRVVKN